MKYTLGFIAIFLLVTSNAFGIEELIRPYRSARTLGMGGVWVTTGEYAEALFGNPARHSEVLESKLSLLDLQFELNSNIIGSFKSVRGVSGSSGAGTISKASSLIGKNQHARFDFIPGYYNPRFIGGTAFAFGLLLNTSVNAQVHYTTDVGAQIATHFGPNVGISRRFLEDRLSVGINMHVLYRIASDDNVSALDFLSGNKGLKVKDLAHQGVGVDADIGGYYFIPWNINVAKIAVGASLNNVMQSHYKNWNPQYIKGLGNNPPASDRLLNFGTRLDFNDFFIFTKPKFAFEMQDVGRTSKAYSFYKRVHTGGELNMSKVIALRVGLNQGYPGGGVGVNLPLLKLDAATYGEELSSNAGILQDRRYVLRIALEI